MSEHNSNRKVGVHWFRHGLRFHDNPALVELLQNCQVFIPIFIFDGHCGFSGAKSVSPNRTRFLLECLQDLSVQLKSKGGQLYVCNKAEPCEVLRRIKQEIGLFQLSFDEDYEPIWHARDEKVRRFCREEGIDTIEHGSHTLWDPRIVIDTNGGVPPLTYQMFLHTVKVIGPPPRPVEDIDWSTIEFGTLLTFASDSVEALESALGSEAVGGRNGQLIRWRGGESQALAQLEHRAAVEAQAFRQGMYLPNQAAPDLLGPPMSLSPALSAGCLSVRRFYWRIHDLYASIHHGHTASCENITGQMVWREYFYTMSVDNKCYGQVLNNPICLDVTWRNATEGKRDLERWKQGATGYPFIDAAMRQLKLEGWIHHVARNAVACFLTRGDLWLNWEEGLAHFLEHLIDADWSVCAGNWLWVSSSAFEQLLDCDQCICPVNYGRRLDPYGEYVKRYVPEVRNLPVQYVYEPWKASLEVQGKAGCIIGKDYPERIVNHQIASQKNRQMMLGLRNSLLELRQAHCRPSSVEEVRQFMWLPEKLNHSCHRVAA